MDKNYLPPIEFLRECFSVDFGAMNVRWRLRPGYHFASEPHGRTWNAKYAGTIASKQGRGGYPTVRVTHDGKTMTVAVHRLVHALETGEREFPELDHIDLDKANFKPENLRPATRQQNMANNAGWAKSGLPKGVIVAGMRFRAQATVGGKTRNLGVHNTPAEAHEAYCEFARAYHGEFFNPGPDRPSIFD